MQSPYSTVIIAGLFDWPLMVIVLGTAVLALAVNVGALVGWLRRRP
jgi:hypothetical protein